ncbi:MAG: T9SS type A sorting domain-containing protein [Bacteroidia bacterium]|nr:T9SS type A sorting domain-containing protein [Bacteroidia bacterium]
MKRVYTIFLFVSMSFIAFGQTFVWEAFDAGQMPPAGWTIDGYASQWSISNTANAGGAVPEAMFTYTSAVSVSRFISPELDLTGLTSVQLSFKHMYDWYSNPAPKVGVATRSAAGPWTSVWEILPTGNVGPQQIDLTITNSDVGAADFQFCVYLDGNFYNLDYYYLDNILLFNPLNLDGAMIALSTPTYIEGPTEVTGTIMNMGTTVITSMDVDWQLDGGPVHSTAFTGLSLATQDTYDFLCADLVDATIGEHTLTAWINKVNGVTDDDQNNDSLSKPLIKPSHVVPRKPCFEEFTSSTCAPCATFNLGGFVAWCQTMAEDITLMKYQMNWPGAGDPYYTEEGGVRRAYYGVGWVPWLVGNGAFVDTDMGAVQNAYDQAVLQPGLASIAAAHELKNHVITVDAAVLPFADFTNTVLHIIVFEYITTGNVGTNGETEFHHVMMKMMPDANGTTQDMFDRTPFSVTETVDLTGTNVEEWDDLGVLVLVQDVASREILQSIYSVEDGVFATDARLDDILVDGSSLPGFDPDVFDYDVEVPGGVLVPDIEGIPMDPNAVVIVEPALEIPGTTIIDVFAEDLTTQNTYLVNFIWAVGQDENRDAAIRVYPNPSAGNIYIHGADHASVSVYSATGVQVKGIDNFTTTVLNLSDLTEGVYMLRIQKENGTMIQKKIVIVK